MENKVQIDGVIVVEGKFSLEAHEAKAKTKPAKAKKPIFLMFIFSFPFPLL